MRIQFLAGWLIPLMLTTTILGLATSNAFSSVPTVRQVETKWEQTTLLPKAMSGMGLTVMNHSLWLVGGQEDSGAATSDVYYSPVNATGALGEWNKSIQSNMNPARYYHAVVQNNDRLYAIGGWTGSSALRTVQSLTIDGSGNGGTWQPQLDLPGARFAAGAVASSGRIYVVGGWDGFGARREAYQAVLADGNIVAWDPLAPLPQERFALSLTEAKGYLYAIGGRNAANVSQREIYRARPDPISGQFDGWLQIGMLPAERDTHAAVVYRRYSPPDYRPEDFLLVIGGRNNSGASTDTVFSARVNDDGSLEEWQTNLLFPALPTPIDRHTAVVVDVSGCGPVIFVAGGRSSGAYQNAVYHTSCQTPTPTPTATPTNTPVATPTSTATPTAVPGIQLQLRAEPSGAVRPGDEITYTIAYSATGNGELTNVVITNAVPSGTEEISGIPQTAQHVKSADQIKRWEIETLRSGEGGTVSYRVVVNQGCKKLTTDRKPTDFGTIAVEPPPNCGPDRYLPGTPVTVTAIPRVDYAFVNWTGALIGAQNPAHVLMDSDKVVTATFTGCFALTTGVEPDNTAGSVTPDPLPNCRGASSYAPGTVVTLTAAANPDFAFRDWVGDITDAANAPSVTNPITVTMNTTRTVTARFQHCVAITRTSDPANAARITITPPQSCPSGGDTFMPNTTVSISTTAKIPLYVWDHWDAVGATLAVTASQSTSLTLGATGVNLTAYYQTCRRLARNVTPDGSGKVEIAPPYNCGSDRFRPNTPVTITAIPENNYAFLNWSGDITEMVTSSQTHLIMDTDKVVTATFTSCFTLTPLADPSTTAGTITRDPPPNCRGDVRYLPDTTVVLTATPKINYAFRAWSGDIANAADTAAAPLAAANVLTVTMNTTRTVTAQFQPCVAITRTSDPAAAGPITLTVATACPGGGSKFMPNTDVAISTTAKAPIYVWDHWSAISATLAVTASQSTTLTLGATDANLTAHYRTCYKLNAAASPETDGQIVFETPYNCGTDRFLAGTVVTLRAAPEQNKSFIRWAGDATGTTVTTTVTMNRDKLVTALFQDTCYSLTRPVTPPGSGTVVVSPADCPNPGQTTMYMAGTNVVLTATAANNYTFVGWSGGVTDTLTRTVIAMTADKVVTATFTSCFQLYTPSDPSTTAGTVARDPLPNCRGGARYLPDTTVVLTATPKLNYAFQKWSGDIANAAELAAAPLVAASPLTVTMNTTHTVTAHFVPCVTVSTAVTPTAGGSALKGGANCLGGTKYEPGSGIPITATRNPRFAFVDWNVTGEDAKIADLRAPITTLTVGVTTTIATATFTTCKTLRTPIAVSPPGSAFITGTVTVEPEPNCDGTHYLPGTPVTLTATAMPGYIFKDWSGGASSAFTTTTVVMDDDKVVTATFQVACFTFATDSNPPLGGSTSATPGLNAACPHTPGLYRYGAAFTVTAQAYSGYAFDAWTSIGSAVNQPASPATTVTLTANTLATANFRNCLSLTISRLPSTAAGTVARDPDYNCSGGGEKYNPGTVVTLTATASSSYTFTHWSGAISGTAPITTITMTGTKTVTANFQKCVTLQFKSNPSALATFGKNDPPNCAGDRTYAPGKKIEIEAMVITTTYSFDHWEASNGALDFPNWPRTSFTPGISPTIVITAHLTPLSSALTVPKPDALSLPVASSQSLDPARALTWPTAITPVVIINEGAYVTWKYNGNEQGPIWSGRVINGPHLFLPLLLKP